MSTSRARILAGMAPAGGPSGGDPDRRPAARPAGGVTAARVRAPRIAGAGLLSGWGEGWAALDRPAPDGPRRLVAVPTPALAGERFRRATRECLLAVAATRAALADAGLDPGALAGERTAILYVSATGYAAANRAFLEDEGSTTLHFPYTSPSAVPAEVTIELGIRGPYVNLMGGATAAFQGLWYAARWLARGAADRVLLVAVEALHEVQDLFERARRLYRGPLVEGAACLVLAPGDGPDLRWASALTGEGDLEEEVGAVLDATLAGAAPAVVLSGARQGALRRAEQRALGRRRLAAIAMGGGELLALSPLAGLARVAASPADALLTATWKSDYATLWWPHRDPARLVG